MNRKNNDSATASEVHKNLQGYAAFIEKKLHPQLESAVHARELVESEISEYQDLHHKLTLVKKRNECENSTDGNKNIISMVDLGHKMAYCRAAITNPELVYVNVGMGFHIQLTIPEALSFCEKRIDFLNKEVLHNRAKKAKVIAGHLEEALLLMEALGKEARDLEKEERFIR